MTDGSPTKDSPNDPLTEGELALLQMTTLQYYLHETNPANGLIRDKTDPNAPASIAAVGLGLATIPCWSSVG